MKTGDPATPSPSKTRTHITQGQSAESRRPTPLFQSSSTGWAATFNMTPGKRHFGPANDALDSADPQPEASPVQGGGAPAQATVQSADVVVPPGPSPGPPGIIHPSEMMIKTVTDESKKSSDNSSTVAKKLNDSNDNVNNDTNSSAQKEGSKTDNLNNESTSVSNTKTNEASAAVTTQIVTTQKPKPPAIVTSTPTAVAELSVKGEEKNVQEVIDKNIQNFEAQFEARTSLKLIKDKVLTPLLAKAGPPSVRSSYSPTGLKDHISSPVNDLHPLHTPKSQREREIQTEEEKSRARESASKRTSLKLAGQNLRESTSISPEGESARLTSGHYIMYSGSSPTSGNHNAASSGSGGEGGENPGEGGKNQAEGKRKLSLVNNEVKERSEGENTDVHLTQHRFVADYAALTATPARTKSLMSLKPEENPKLSPYGATLIGDNGILLLEGKISRGYHVCSMSMKSKIIMRAKMTRFILHPFRYGYNT
jgi:hypothetical protein